MKHTFTTFLISIFLLTGNILAQETESKDFLPKAGDFGTSIIIDGLIDNIQLNSTKNQYGQNLIFVKRYLKDDFVLRAGFGLNIQSTKRTNVDSVGVSLVTRDSSQTRYLINISGGIEKHLTPHKRLDPYLFSQMDITFIGKTNTEINTTTESNAGTARVDRTIKEDGGIAIGVSAGLGFNYFISNRFSVGSELAFKLLFASEGGTITDNQITTPINGQSSSSFSTRDEKLNTLDINVQPNLLINLSYFF